MPTMLAVTDPADPRLGDYVRLRESVLRTLIETERGIFIAEGSKVIRRALEAGYRPRSFLLAQRWLPDLAELIEPHDVPVYVVSEVLAEQVTGFHVHRGALASLYRGEDTSTDQVLAGNRIVVLEDLVDHTNVGAVIRNAAGLGWNGVLVSQRCADPLYRRSVKVSMGTVFSLPWARLVTDDLSALTAAGFTLVALALGEDSVPLAEFSAGFDPHRKLAILLGTEGAGLSPAWQRAADISVMVPMTAGVDSLNVAAASAIACYALGPASVLR